MHRRPRTGLLLLATALGAACTSTDRPAPSPAEGAPAKTVEERGLQNLPWTDAFRQPAVLIATEVRIEGPRGLLQHVATISDPSEFQRVEKTTAEGFLQEIVVKPELEEGGAQIRAQLDQLAIVATHRLHVLERPGPVDVVVVARGDAYWARGQETEQRGETLRLEGKIAR
ncbi:MAG: hypothetical protein ACKVXR_11210 [Planctomycetota bacterium]